MALSIGTRLGPYEIVSAIGAGGMGEVYRATDTNLKRSVAIKVLPASVAGDAERLARFQREAEVLAALNHPNIAQIHGLEKSGGNIALVMELVEGPTLADRIAEGPIPPSTALPIAKQIAEALEAAHEQGIIHRDLKPANIKVREDGTVKVLDFGLAKLVDAESGSQDPRYNREDPRFSQSPTITTPAMTHAGVILGTAAYMSPEQAKGRAVDKRSDVWAFGAVLYEMLTGKRAFAGSDVSEVLASVLAREPDWARLPSSVSPVLATYLRRCLHKDPKQRIHDIGDVRLAMEGAFDSTVSALPEQTAAPQLHTWQRPTAVAVIAVAAAALASLAVWAMTRPPPQPVARFSLTLPPGDTFTSVGRHLVALSPDGTRLVFVANSQLYLREMDQLEATPIRGTDGGARTPFFSPDGQWIGFWADGSFRKVAVTGGAPVTLCEATNPFGASWAADDTILFGQGTEGILRVSANGGTPEVLIPMDAERNEQGHGPQLLPDGHTVLFTLSTTGVWDEAQIVTQSLDTGERRVLIEGGRDARYVPTGHVVYAVAETLLAAPFDVERLEVTGGPVPVVEGVASGGLGGSAHASISDSGSLVYVPVSGLSRPAASQELVRVDREGNASPLTDTLADWESPRFSPDGQRLAVRRGDPGQDVWILELSRGTLTRLTFESGLRPLWSPDGETVFFTSLRVTPFNIFSTPADGSGPARQVTNFPIQAFPAAITSDGQTLIFRQGGLSENFDVGMVRLEEGAEPEMLLQSSFDEHTPKLSPDDRWLAYVSNESGRDEVYVTRFPTGGKWQISTEGGTEPMWSRDGRELFYRNGEMMMAVAISPGSEFAPGRPTMLFERPYVLKVGPGATNYDVTPDGQGFVMIRNASVRESTGPPQQIILVQNWLQELERLVPRP